VGVSAPPVPPIEYRQQDACYQANVEGDDSLRPIGTDATRPCCGFTMIHPRFCRDPGPPLGGSPCFLGLSSPNQRRITAP
jgi:hypothetical protein